MKIVICTKLDLAGNLALNRLIHAFPPHHEVHVLLSDYVLKEERQNPLAAFLVRHERDFPVGHFFPWIDRMAQSGMSSNGRTFASTFTGLASENGMDIRLCGPAKSPATLDILRHLAPDILISCRYDYILPAESLAVPPLGAYGLHPGSLPAIQGLCAPFWAMHKGDRNSGCTLFRIDQGIDTGPVIEIGWNKIDYARSLLWNFVHTYYAGIDVLMHHIHRLEAGLILEGVPQDQALRHYYSYPSENDFQKFLQGGGMLVNDADYLEMLSWYIPEESRSRIMPQVQRWINAHDLDSIPNGR